MGKTVSRRITYVLVALWTVMSACGSSEEAQDKSNAKPRQFAEEPVVDIDFVNLTLPDPDKLAATIQLYRGKNEASRPELYVGSPLPLTLEFDLMEPDGRPLRITFRHTDRRWVEDYLVPSQFMVSQAADNIIEYRRDNALESTYTHYHYEFPNRNVGFKISGNYVLTVTDPTRNQRLLFERPFLVSEQSVEMAFELRGVQIPGAPGVRNQPYMLIDPRPYPNRDIFDWGACFVKNTRYDLGRCGRGPSLFESPYISFDLEPRASFEPEPDLHILDLSELHAGIYVEEVIFDTTPYEVVLVPDQADMGGLQQSFQNGQSVIDDAVLDVNDPDIASEYVMARFSYVPDGEVPALGEVFISGSFNGWTLDPANELEWNEETRRYEGAILIKQGIHGYQYVITGERPPSQGVFAPESSYSGLLYYFDPTTHTDRLVAVRSVIAP